MKKIEQDEQRKLQLKILERFIKICEKYNLRYSVSGGTLIGSLRHEGYIPWDDDIDVDMPREDYEKFIHLYKKHYNGGEIKIIDRREEKLYHLNFAKLHDTKTILREKNVLDKYAMLYGIYIDIFPLDNVSGNKENRRKFLKKNYYALKLITMNVYDKDDIKHNSQRMRRLYNMAWRILKIVPINLLTGIEEMRIKRYSKENKGSGYLRELGFGTKDFECAFHESDFSSYIKKKFEHLEVNVPVGYDRILRSEYGDYMQLPPEEERINHGLEVYELL